MIFPPQTVKQIRAQTVTMTRRQVTGKTCHWQTNKAYQVQPGRKTGQFPITITEIRQEPLGAISLRDVKREGFRTTQDFYDHWQQQHGRLDLDQLVWVIAFVLGDFTDTDRYLAARAGGPGGDYTSSRHRALSGEDAPALSVVEQEHFSRLAHSRDHDRSAEPLRIYRDQLRADLEQIKDGSDHRQTWRLKRKLRALDAKIAA